MNKEIVKIGRYLLIPKFCKFCEFKSAILFCPLIQKKIDPSDECHLPKGLEQSEATKIFDKKNKELEVLRKKCSNI